MTQNDYRIIQENLGITHEIPIERDSLKNFKANGYIPTRRQMVVFFEKLKDDDHYHFYVMYHKDGKVVCHA